MGEEVSPPSRKEGVMPEYLDEVCPRCYSAFLYDPIEANALSRLTRGTQQKIWVCSGCGVQEGLEEMQWGVATPILIEDPSSKGVTAFKSSRL